MCYEVCCGHQIHRISAIVIRGCYYGHVNNAVHGVNSVRVYNHVLVHRVVIEMNAVLVVHVQKPKNTRLCDAQTVTVGTNVEHHSFARAPDAAPARFSLDVGLGRNKHVVAVVYGST